MNIVEIATKAEGKAGFRFRVKGTHAPIAFEPSGHPQYIGGARFDLTDKSLRSEYEIICDHDHLTLIGMDLREGVHCKFCGRDFKKVKPIEEAPLPEAPKALPAKQTFAPEEIEEFCKRRISGSVFDSSPFIEPGFAV